MKVDNYIGYLGFLGNDFDDTSCSCFIEFGFCHHMFPWHPRLQCYWFTLLTSIIGFHHRLPSLVPFVGSHHVLPSLHSTIVSRFAFINVFHDFIFSIPSWLTPFHHWLPSLDYLPCCFSSLSSLKTDCEFDNEYDIDFVLRCMCVHSSHFVQVVVHPFWSSLHRKCRSSTQTLQITYMCTCWYRCEISATGFFFTVGTSTWATLLMLWKGLYMVYTTYKGRLVDAMR